MSLSKSYRDLDDTLPSDSKWLNHAEQPTIVFQPFDSVSLRQSIDSSRTSSTNFNLRVSRDFHTDAMSNAPEDNVNETYDDSSNSDILLSGSDYWKFHDNSSFEESTMNATIPIDWKQKAVEGKNELDEFELLEEQVQRFNITPSVTKTFDLHSKDSEDIKRRFESKESQRTWGAVTVHDEVQSAGTQSMRSSIDHEYFSESKPQSSLRGSEDIVSNGRYRDSFQSVEEKAAIRPRVSSSSRSVLKNGIRPISASRQIIKPVPSEKNHSVESSDSKNIYSNSITTKAKELEEQLQYYTEENAKLKQLRKQQENTLAEITQQKANLTDWINEEKVKFDSWCNETRQAIAKDKRQSAKLLRDARQQAANISNGNNVPLSIRQTKQEIEGLQATIVKLKTDYDTLMKKYKASEFRHLQHRKDVQNSIQEIENQYEKLEIDKINLWKFLDKSHLQIPSSLLKDRFENFRHHKFENTNSKSHRGSTEVPLRTKKTIDSYVEEIVDPERYVSTSAKLSYEVVSHDNNEQDNDSNNAGNDQDVDYDSEIFEDNNRNYESDTDIHSAMTSELNEVDSDPQLQYKYKDYEYPSLSSKVSENFIVTDALRSSWNQQNSKIDRYDAHNTRDTREDTVINLFEKSNSYSGNRVNPKNTSITAEDSNILPSESKTATVSAKVPEFVSSNSPSKFASNHSSAAPMSPPSRTEEILPNGTTVITYRNGTRKEIFKDGGSIIRFANGDTKIKDPLTGSEVYHYAQANTKHTTYPDGLQIYEFPNGQVRLFYILIMHYCHLTFYYRLKRIFLTEKLKLFSLILQKKLFSLMGFKKVIFLMVLLLDSIMTLEKKLLIKCDYVLKYLLELIILTLI